MKKIEKPMDQYYTKISEKYFEINLANISEI
jgi:hypothetical protein